MLEGECISGSPSVVAFEVKSVNGTNILSSSVKPSEPQKDHKTPGGHGLREFCLQKHSTAKSGQQDDLEKQQNSGKGLVMGHSI